MARRAKVSFDDVRSILYDPPSVVSWRRLWGVLIKMKPQMLQEEVLPYVKELLLRWPPGLRPLPPAARPLFYGTEEKRNKVKASIRLVAPLADHLQLQYSPPTTAEMVQLANNPLCEHIVRLTLFWSNERGGVTRPQAVQAVANSRFLGSVKRLEWGIALDHEGTEALVGSSWFQGLEHLNLTGFVGGKPKPFAMPSLHTLEIERPCEGLMKALSGADALPNLRKAIIKSSYAEDMPSLSKALNKAEALDTLELEVPGRSYLVLPADEQAGEVVRQILTSSRLRARLKSLRLYGGYSNTAAVSLFKLGVPFAKLESLDIVSFPLEPEQTCDLLTASALRSVKSIKLDHVPVTSPVIKALAEGPLAPGLRSLTLKSAGMKPDTLKALVEAEGLASLEALNIKANRTIGARGLKRLIKPHKLQNLSSLAIDGPNVTDDLVKGIEANPSFAGLETLSIFPCVLSLQGLYERLTSLSWPERLQALHDFFELMDRSRLLELLKGLGQSVPSKERTKPLLVERVAHLGMDNTALAAVLCAPVTGRAVGLKALKATAKRHGIKGYSKYRVDELVDIVIKELGEDGRGLLGDEAGPSALT